MCPVLKEIRKLIKKIKKIDPKVFPIEIVGGLYDKPDGFSKESEFCYIQETSIGYLTTHDKYYPEFSANYCGAPVSSFPLQSRIEVKDELQRVLDDLIERKAYEREKTNR